MTKVRFPLRVDEKLMQRIETLSENMLRDRTSVLHEAAYLGMNLIETPEYYEARLIGKTDIQIRDSIRQALKNLVKKPHGSQSQ